MMTKIEHYNEAIYWLEQSAEALDEAISQLRDAGVQAPSPGGSWPTADQKPAGMLKNLVAIVNSLREGALAMTQCEHDVAVDQPCPRCEELAAAGFPMMVSRKLAVLGHTFEEAA